MDTHSSNALDPHQQVLQSIPLHSAVYQQIQHQQQQHSRHQDQQYNPYNLGALQQGLSNAPATETLLSHAYSQDVVNTSQAHDLPGHSMFYSTSNPSHLHAAEQNPPFPSGASHIPQALSIDHQNQAAIPPRSVSIRDGRQVQSAANHVQAPQSGRVQTYQLKFESPLKLIEDPPHLPDWRERFFHVDEPMFVTEDEFQTYFPHVDNVYSHRSTQTYKLKPFVSHYWDCRLKGRPPGTAKSTDPSKKKRKRVARERDLCDVKIKITEYKRGIVPQELEQQQRRLEYQAGPLNVGPFPSAASWSGAPSLSSAAYETQATKWFSIQRVNGNGGNGKSDGVPGPHQHTLEESDRVKRNSIFRLLLAKNEKARRTAQPKQQKTYARKATGKALNTVKAHSADDALKLYGACFCPFVQRAWISLEIKRMSYQYIEVDPYKKPQSLLDISPKGLVPAVRHGLEWSINDSAIIMEYLEDLGEGPPLLPSTPQQKAHSRLWTLHVHSKIIPAFYRYLQEQESDKQAEYAKDFKEAIITLVDAADQTGPFFLGPEISFVDVQVAPWIIRMRRVLSPYRGWPDPEPGTRYAKWVDAIENHKAVQATTSTEDLYLDSYERYAENRPNTSQVADAINSGRGLP